MEMAWNFVEGSMEKHGNGMEFRSYSGVRTLIKAKCRHYIKYVKNTNKHPNWAQIFSFKPSIFSLTNHEDRH